MNILKKYWKLILTIYLCLIAAALFRETFGEGFFSSIFNSIALALLVWKIQRPIFFWMIDQLAQFHLKHNKENIDKFPVKIVIQHKATLKLYISRFLCLALIITISALMWNECLSHYF